MLLTLAIALLLLIALILLKVNAFLAFLITSIVAGFMSGMEVSVIIQSIETGLGNTLGSLTIILGFGAVIGKLMADSGAAQQIADQLVRLFGVRYLKWSMTVIGFLVGLPMFFAIGFVILIPLMFSVAKKAGVSFIYLGIPLVASLSTLHGLLPPHPAPTAITQQFGADMGEVILWGLVIGIPTIILAGPLFASLLKNMEARPLKIFSEQKHQDKLPGTRTSVFCALLPVILLMLETVIGGFIDADTITGQIVSFLSQPLTSMLISTLVIIYILQLRRGAGLKQTMKLFEDAISGIAMILLIIGGAGALNQVFIDAGINESLALQLKELKISPILLCWTLAAFIRIALGSATVAAMTTAGMLAPVYVGSSVNPVLLVLAAGSGSLIFSHVNDGGFWLFREYFNLSIRQTLLSWSLMETIIALTGLAGCLILNMFI